MKLASLTTQIQTYEITAVIESALCIGAGGSSGSLADKPIVRNAAGHISYSGFPSQGTMAARM